MFGVEFNRVQTTPGAVPDAACDMNSDGTLNFSDFVSFVQGFGKVPGAAPAN